MEKTVELRPRHAMNKPTQLWVVASGKGGVGKTFIASSLAITLSKMGRSVTLIDMDTTGANIHTSLGLAPNTVSIRDWAENRRSLQECLLPTNLPRLSYVQGLWDSWAMSEFTHDQIKKLIPEMKALPSDIVIVDLGAGATPTHLELFRGADEKFLVSSPEPTSVEKTYRFIENHICASLKENALPEAYDRLVDVLRAHRQRTLKKQFSFRSYLKENSGFVIDHFEDLSRNPVRLIVNASRSEGNANLGHSMRSVCNKYFDLHIDFLGSIDFDNAVWQSIRNREPVLIAQPFTPLSGQFLTICKHLIAPDEMRAVG